MRYSIRVTDPATIEVISLEAAKEHLRVDDDSEDELIAAMLLAAIEAVERQTSYLLTDREMEIAWPEFPSFPELLTIPREPVTEIDRLVYNDANDVEVEIIDYRWSESAPDQVLPAFRQPWPIASGEAGSVRLTFRAGHDDAGLIPPALIAAVKLLLGHLYANREAVSVGAAAVTEYPLGFTALCASFRRMAI